MTLGHEKLDVYRLSIGYVDWVYEKAETLIGVHRSARDQMIADEPVDPAEHRRGQR